MLSDSEESQEEKQGSSFTNLKQTKSDKIKDLSKVEKIHFIQSNDNDLLVMENSTSKYQNIPLDDSEIKENTTSLYDDLYNELTETSLVDDEFAFTDDKNTNEKEFNIDSKPDPSPKNTHFIEKKKTTTVKMQVLLARLETDIDIVETIDLLLPLENILKVEWSIQSLDSKVVLPSKTVFLKGEFIAEIEFSNGGSENKIQSLKVPIPWSKTANIDWLTVPDFPHSSQNEFAFQSQHEHDSSFHYESYHKFAEPIHSQLNQINFVWYQELNSKDKQLHVNGAAQLYIHFMQEQFVELD